MGWLILYELHTASSQEWCEILHVNFYEREYSTGRCTRLPRIDRSYRRRETVVDGTIRLRTNYSKTQKPDFELLISCWTIPKIIAIPLDLLRFSFGCCISCIVQWVKKISNFDWNVEGYQRTEAVFENFSVIVDHFESLGTPKCPSLHIASAMIYCMNGKIYYGADASI